VGESKTEIAEVRERLKERWAQDELVSSRHIMTEMARMLDYTNRKSMELVSEELFTRIAQLVRAELVSLGLSPETLKSDVQATVRATIRELTLAKFPWLHHPDDPVAGMCHELRAARDALSASGVNTRQKVKDLDSDVRQAIRMHSDRLDALAKMINDLTADVRDELHNAVAQLSDKLVKQREHFEENQRLLVEKINQLEQRLSRVAAVPMVRRVRRRIGGE